MEDNHTLLPVISVPENDPSALEDDVHPESLTTYQEPRQATARTWWAAAKHAAATFASIPRARRGTPQLPRILTHTVTFGCNARCVMCDSWKLPTQGDLTLSQIEQIYQQLPIMDVVRLTGGEPFMRHDLPDIVDLAVRHLQPWMLHISSNGFLTDRVLHLCQQRDQRVPLELSLSIDGVGDFHNAIRGSSIAFSTVWKTLELLAPLQKSCRFHLVVNQTITNNDGLQQYHDLATRLQELGIEHHLIVAYSESATYSTERDLACEVSLEQPFAAFADLDPLLLDKALRFAETQARTLPWHRRWARRYYLRGIRSRLLQGKRTPNPICQALHSHMRLFPNGDVPVCQFNSHIVGNLRVQTFQDVWHGNTIAPHRQWVRKCAGCWAECEVLPSAIYTADLLVR